MYLKFPRQGIYIVNKIISKVKKYEKMKGKLDGEEEMAYLFT